MYRGRPSPRGGYPPPFEGRGPPPPRPYPAPGYRDDRNRPKPTYHPAYHDHGHPDPYRRSPPRRRYPSPGSGSHREYWAGGPQRERSPSPCVPVPLDRNLVITVGNELTGLGSSHHHDRDYIPRPEYEQGRCRDQSLDRSRAKSRGRSKSRARSKSRPRSQSCSPKRNRAKSRPRSQSRSPGRSRAKSRPRSQSRSPGRSRAKSRPRSQSRSPGRSRAKSRHRSQSRSLDRSRAMSRGRSKSRPNSRCGSRSRSRSRSRERSRGRSRGRSYGKAASTTYSKHRQRSRSQSSSASSSLNSSSGSGDNSDKKSRKEFKELETARRRKELEEMLSLPTKSILKKRNDSEDSPSLRSTDSPRGVESSGISRVADQLLLAVKGMEPHKVASILSELRSDPRMAQRAGLDTEIREILNLLGEQVTGGIDQEKTLDDIDDEEKFLYGDSEEPIPPPVSEPVRHHGFDLYGDVTEEALYGDYTPQKGVVAQTYGVPPGTSSQFQAPPTTGEADLRYASQLTTTPDQNITLQVSNPTYLPGTEPLDDSERQALEEYDQIQDLLKTIGLDLGVAEISKMAARTKERLHGNKPPPKTPTRRRHYSSGSSNGSQGHRRRSHSGSSSSRSRSRSRDWGGNRGGSWSSDDSRRKSSALPKSHKDRDIKETKAERGNAAPHTHKETSPQQPHNDPNHLPPHPGMPIPTYPPSQVHGIMPPNFPPPGYGQYGNYLPYMHQQWPPMYPPPNMTLPPQTGPDEFPPTLSYMQPYSKALPEAGAKGVVKSVQDSKKGKTSNHDRGVSEEENNESQKQKVLEEREKLKQDREIRMKKKEYLMKELERLRKQQGELLRKKRREKGGHKDPLLQEISHLQEEVMAQISSLRKEHEAAEQKRNEIDKVALILGLSPSDRPRRISKPTEEQDNSMLLLPPPGKKTQEAERSPEGGQTGSSSMTKISAASSLSRASPDKPPQAPPLSSDRFEYYDAGNHWCKNCNVTSGSMFDFFTHLHSKTHRKTLDLYERPWASTPTKTIKNTPSEETMTKPAKGSEFLLPVRGFFCVLCREFYGDAICAEEHVTTHAHNEKYKKQMYENPLYEQRRNLDRQAGLALEMSGKKRKHEEDEKGHKEREEKSKNKKEKKEKEKKKEEDDAVQKGEKAKVKKEEEEKLRMSKKEEDFKDGDEKYKYNKKDDKYCYNRDDEMRAKYSRSKEDDKYKHGREEEHRYRYHRDEDDRYDDRPKYGKREEEDKYKSSKLSDIRSKYDREQDVGKPKAEKEAFNKLDPGKPAGKPEVSKPEPLPKPYDPPKIICGPSPAMRAKLRKQSLEASKPAPGAVTPSFGKFTWKKRETILAKEAQKVAAEFIKEDEAAVKQNPVSVEDSFAKSVAVAKEIAEKLGGQHSMPAPWVSSGPNRGRIRPNLPAPAAVLRKTAMMGKPAPLNTFLSIRPQNSSLQGNPPSQNSSLQGTPASKFGPIFLDPLTKALNAQNALLESKTQPPIGRPGQLETTPATAAAKPEPSEAKPLPPVSTPPPFEVKNPQPVSKLTPLELKPVLSEAQSSMSKAKPATSETTPALSLGKPAPVVCKPDPPVLKPAPIQSKSVLFEAQPSPSEANSVLSADKSAQPAMIKIVSDVAAPGVPESEQTRTVFVKPPPFVTMGDRAQNSDKLKSNLAAAKAQDLFDIFYSSNSQSGTSSIAKPAKDVRANGNSNNNSQPPATPAQKPQPKLQLLTQSQPSTKDCVSTQPDSNSSSSHQNQPESDIQIASVWSLQSTLAPKPEVAPSQTTSQTTQPKLNPPAQSEAHSVLQNQSSTPKFESKSTQQTEPAQLEPTPPAQSQSILSSPVQREPQSEPQPDQDTQPQAHLETHPDKAPEPKPKPSPKTRGKTMPTKRTPPAPRPVRQTRSQTRYQTRQQQQSQSEQEPEPVSGDSVSAAVDPNELDTSDPGSDLNQEKQVPSERDSEEMDVIPDTLGLPSDMTSLDFEYDFNFE